MNFDQEELIIGIVVIIAFFVIIGIIIFIREYRRPPSKYSYLWKTWMERTKHIHVASYIIPNLDCEGWNNDDDLKYWIRVDNLYKSYVNITYIDDVKLNENSYKLLPTEEKIKVINNFLAYNTDKVSTDNMPRVCFDSQYEKDKAIERAKELKKFIKDNANNIKGASYR